MKLGFEIVEYRSGNAGMLYTIHFDGRAQSEYDAFLADPICAADPGFAPLNARLRSMIDTEGIEPRMFQTRHYEEPLGRLFFKPKTGLRLYCWFSGNIIIAGCGAVKLTTNLAETPAARKAYEELLYVARLLRSRLLIAKTLWITPSGFGGDRIFKKEK